MIGGLQVMIVCPSICNLEPHTDTLLTERDMCLCELGGLEMLAWNCIHQEQMDRDIVAHQSLPEPFLRELKIHHLLIEWVEYKQDSEV
jgi:hypothetical protein